MVAVLQNEHNQQLFVALQPFVLASASLRRRRFLEQLGIAFDVLAAEVDETLLKGEAPVDFVRRLATAKAEVIADRCPSAWVLGADTVVVVDGEVLGKPGNEGEAMAMLKRLTGRRHEVLTGFCLCRGDRSMAANIYKMVKTEVCFAALPEEVLKAYVATGEPFDKAGGYGIQGKGGFLVAKLRGSYSNVVGLPLAEVLGELLRLQIIRPHGL